MGANGGKRLARDLRRLSSAPGRVAPQHVSRSVRELLAVVPDIGRKPPIVSDLFPNHDVFAGNFLRIAALGLEAEGSNLARRSGPERLDVEGGEFGVAGLFRDVFPHCLDRSSALYHGRSRWERGRIIGIEGRDAGEITLVEQIYPFRIHRLDLGSLSKRRSDQAGYQSNHQSDPEHDP